MKTPLPTRMTPAGVVAFSVLVLFVSFASGVERQAPFCVDDLHEPKELANFNEIFEYHRNNTSEYVPLSPDGQQSPSGYIKEIKLSHITTTTHLLPEKHTWRVFNGVLHVMIKARNESEGLEGLFVQAIAAPLGVPFGEFQTNFECGDCNNTMSKLLPLTSLLGCAFRPAASYLHPTVLVIGGKTASDPKFKEAHFHFRYVDYPCFDIMYAQLLIVAVRKFGPKPLYETFYSPIYQTNIEGVGAYTPMYYGWPTEDIECHNLDAPLDNWFAQKNSRVKLKFNEEYDECVRTNNRAKALGEGNICPPGPVTCGADAVNPNKPPKTVSQWKRMRKNYISQHNKEKGTEIFCYDCGNYSTSSIGHITWPPPDPPPIDEEEEVSIVEIFVNRIIRVKPKYGSADCERRDDYGKTPQGSRDVSKDKQGCELDLKTKMVNAGYRWGQRSMLLHGLMMIFAFTVASNCLIYCARFLKEANIIDKGSACWGIGNWLWNHMFWTYLAGAAMWAGFTMFAFQDKMVVCQLYNSKEDTDFCKRTIYMHKVFGGCAVLIFHMSYFTGWARPKAAIMRNILVGYHAVAGYLSKYLALLCLSLIPGSEYDWLSITLIVFIELTFILAFILGTMTQRLMDAEMEVAGERKMFPVPEGVATHQYPPYGKVRGLLFPVLVIAQIGLFGFLFMYHLADYVKVEIKKP